METWRPLDFLDRKFRDLGFKVQRLSVVNERILSS